NDRRDIPRLLAALDGDVDVVNGWRTPRRDPWLRRRLPSAVANRLVSLVTGTALHDYGCTLRAMRAPVARELQLYGELHRFIPALAADLRARLVVLLAILMVVVGIQFVSIGLLGEMLVRTYHESQAKPIYRVREVVELTSQEGVGMRDRS